VTAGQVVGTPPTGLAGTATKSGTSGATGPRDPETAGGVDRAAAGRAASWGCRGLHL